MDEGALDRLDRLERQLGELRDELAIYRLIATYGPAADSRQEDAVAAMWAAEGSYDYGRARHDGNRDVGSLVNNASHMRRVESGCAHVMSLPLVRLHGDKATATSYSRVYVHAGGQWIVEKASANRWELVRGDDGWKVQRRVNRPLDGSQESRELLSRGLEVPT